ncbi:PspC domain-containing protein [Crossiella cryophila]|uniref:Phage shock protein PspC (Stress-responsive transcriptional regulator) n=1 Tax=Crossiella cryophila TaxID=43355 RepID=A0A7W7FSZ3_9PSEU|nr:PspC domain-containing protein [Crossiella cryophila]MBB4674244.1 phage shock protein PspC (stress-responsive transcriptional regulator) [Crossiella cryophila]
MRVEETLRDLWSSRPRRPKDDRKIAGVAAAIGNRYAIDPVVIRVGLVVTAVYGGIGLIVYLAGWLLLPGPEDRVSPLESLLGRGHSATPKVLTLLLLFGMLPAFGWAATTFIGGIFALVMVVGLAYLLHRSRGKMPAPPPPPVTGYVPPPMPMPPFPAPETTTYPVPPVAPDQPTMDLRTPAPEAPETPAATETTHTVDLGIQQEQVTSRVEPVAETSTQAADAPVTTEHPAGAPQFTQSVSTPETPEAQARREQLPAPSFPPVTYPATGTPPQWDPLGAAPFAWDLPEPRRTTEVEAEPEPKRKTRVTSVTLALAFIVGSVSGILAGLVPWFTAPHVVGMVVAVLAIGTLVGAFRGGGRLLVVLGFPVAIVAIGLTASQYWTQSVGERSFRVTSASQLEPNYRLGAGSIDLDLSALDLNDPKVNASTSIVVGAGTIHVVVPKDVDLDLFCKSAIGSVQCLGNERDGGGEVKLDDNGADGPGGGKLRLRAEVQGPGSVEVHRVG